VFLWSVDKLVMFVTAIALASEAVGAASGGANPSPSPAVDFIPPAGIGVCIIAFVRRKQAIGGWLMYFIAQVFLWLAKITVLIAGAWRSYAPEAWSDSRQYFLFILGTIPYFVAMAGVAGVCVAMLRSRTWIWVVHVRRALTVCLVIGLLDVVIDAMYFPNYLPYRVASLIFTVIFLPYLFLSTRVRHVFQTHDWYLVTDPRRAAGTPGILPPRPSSGFGLPEAEHRAGGIDDDA